MGWEAGATMTARGKEYHSFRFLRTEKYCSSKKSTSLERNKGLKDPQNFWPSSSTRATAHQLALYSQGPGGLGTSLSLDLLSY